MLKHQNICKRLVHYFERNRKFLLRSGGIGPKHSETDSWEGSRFFVKKISFRKPLFKENPAKCLLYSWIVYIDSKKS
jgi:hypothetical protein